MKILYVIEHISAVGGLERILVDKMNAFANEPGCEVMLMTVWQEKDGPAFPLDTRVGTVCLGLERPMSRLGLLAAMPRVLHIYNNKVREAAPDVVVHFRAVGAMLTAFSSWKGYTVFEAHTARPHSNHRWLYPFMECRADVVVCLTKGDAMNYPKARRVEVIPNFTEVGDIKERKTSRSTDSCLFVGRLSPEKDPLRLVRLWKGIVARCPHLVLDIYGAGELEESVRAEIERLGLEGCVVMHGYAKDMAQVYAGAELLLLCSRTEGLPMVVMEAMCHGLPVVGTDCQYGPADLIENGETGFLVEQNDDEAFVDAVVRLMADETLRKRMGERARETSARYSKEIIVERWKKIFMGYEDTALG